MYRLIHISMLELFFAQIHVKIPQNKLIIGNKSPKTKSTCSNFRSFVVVSFLPPS